MPCLYQLPPHHHLPCGTPVLMWRPRQCPGHMHEPLLLLPECGTYSMHQLEEMDLERGIQLVTLNDNGYNAPFYPSHNGYCLPFLLERGAEWYAQTHGGATASAGPAAVGTLKWHRLCFPMG